MYVSCMWFFLHSASKEGPVCALWFVRRDRRVRRYATSRKRKSATVQTDGNSTTLNRTVRYRLESTVKRTYSDLRAVPA